MAALVRFRGHKSFQQHLVVKMDNMAMLKAVCLASGAAMHVAPIPTMKEIRASRSTLNYHIAPYASTLLNHSVNLWYALIRQDGPLIIHRCAGIIAQSYYLYTYLSFCPPAKTADNKRWLTWVAGILAAIFVELHLILPVLGLTASYNAHIGFFGAITGIGLAASPLATVREVLKQRDASSLPFLLCAMVTLQCSSWTIYGYLRVRVACLLNCCSSNRSRSLRLSASSSATATASHFSVLTRSLNRSPFHLRRMTCLPSPTTWWACCWAPSSCF